MLKTIPANHKAKEAIHAYENELIEQLTSRAWTTRKFVSKGYAEYRGAVSASFSTKEMTETYSGKKYDYNGKFLENDNDSYSYEYFISVSENGVFIVLKDTNAFKDSRLRVNIHNNTITSLEGMLTVFAPTHVIFS